MTTPSPVVSAPREPTEAMLRAGQASFADGTHREALAIYRAMIAAAVPPHEEGAEDDPTQAMDDAVLYGTGFLLDGVRVDPRRMTMLHGPAQQSSDVSSLVEAAQDLLSACISDFGDPADFEGDDGAVAASSEGDCAVTFKQMRDLREALAQAKQVQG